MLVPIVAVAVAFTYSSGAVRPAVSARASVVAVDPGVATALSPEQLQLVGTGVVVALGGAVAYSKKGDTATPPSPPLVVPPLPPPPPKRAAPIASTWGLYASRKTRKRAVVQHPKMGTMAKKPPREFWKPPPGWTPPTKPVSSWYDNGLRLADTAPPPPAPPAAPESFMDKLMGFFNPPTPAPAAAAGGSDWGLYASGRTRKRAVVPHPKMGTMPKKPPREFYKPPPAAPAPPPAPTVVSWYDAGKRL